MNQDNMGEVSLDEEEPVSEVPLMKKNLLMM
jgi:hypothetical protein